MKRATKDIGLFISIEKQKQQRSLYYTQKYTNDGIYGSLHSDNRIGYILETAMNKAFRVDPYLFSNQSREVLVR